MPRKGLVIGKFYPPHAGHYYLIDTALAQSEEVTVLVCRLEGQNPNADLRAAWLRELYPHANVQTIDDIGEDDNSELWASYTIESLGFRPDVVFTSEDYGDPYAHFIGCQHVLVDKSRQTVPVSGRSVRANPFANWQYLAPPVRAFYALRIALVGAESTGTTTLSRDLAAKYATPWVPEYGRLFSEGKATNQDSPWRTDEFLHIAAAQNALEDFMSRFANKALFCDTNAFATSIWHERYVGHWSTEVEALSTGRNYALYVVTDDSIPFVNDGFRDGEHIRHWMHLRFIEELETRNLPYIVAVGTQEERLAQVSREVDHLLSGEM